MNSRTSLRPVFFSAEVTNNGGSSSHCSSSLASIVFRERARSCCFSLSLFVKIIAIGSCCSPIHVINSKSIFCGVSRASSKTKVQYKLSRLIKYCSIIFPHAYLEDWTILDRSEEHTSELQSLTNLVCRLLLEKKKNTLNRPCADHTIQRVSVTNFPSRDHVELMSTQTLAPVPSDLRMCYDHVSVQTIALHTFV